jgi:glucose dehydrogenase
VERYREVTSDVDWSGYNGDPSGNRYSKLSQIDTANVSRLAPRWIFQLPDGTNLQLTPVVQAGVMYVTSANECWALDAGSDRSIWHYQRRRRRGIGGTAAQGVNRGVAVAGQASCLWKASPVTYRFDGQQYVAVPTGQSIISFGLPVSR